MRKINRLMVKVFAGMLFDVDARRWLPWRNKKNALPSKVNAIKIEGKKDGCEINCETGEAKNADL